MTDQLDLLGEPPVCPECGGRGFVMVRRDCACQDESVHENTPGKLQREAKRTAWLAALRAEPRTGRDRWKALVAIARAYADGRIGLIDEELPAEAGIPDNAHRTRRRELVLGGWVEASDDSRLTPAGNESIIWTLTDKGQAWQRLQAP